MVDEQKGCALKTPCEFHGKASLGLVSTMSEIEIIIQIKVDNILVKLLTII